MEKTQTDDFSESFTEPPEVTEYDFASPERIGYQVTANSGPSHTECSTTTPSGGTPSNDCHIVFEEEYRYETVVTKNGSGLLPGSVGLRSLQRK